MSKTEITAGLPVAELIEAYPPAVAFLAERNLFCIVCGEPVWGSIKEFARDHQLDDAGIELLVNDLKLAAASW